MSKKRPNIKNTAQYLFVNLAALLAAVLSALNLERQYPLMREFFLFFFFSEALTFCCLLFLEGKFGNLKREKYIKKCLADWLIAGGEIKLSFTRMFFLLVQILLLAMRPDFFKANIMMVIGILVILILFIMQSKDILQKYKILSKNITKPAQVADREASLQFSTAQISVPKKQKKTRIRIIFALAAFLIYFILGVLISGFPQPKISDEYKENFHPEDFYGTEDKENHPFGDRAVILEDNREALIERVRMIRGAKERIILSTFDFRTDISGKTLLSALLDAADRGVSVKIVVDGVCGLLRMEQNPYFFALSSHENVEIRIYNRINPLLPWRLMGRLHDKYLIADTTAYILGGRNSFSYFLGDWPGHKNYDRDVLVYNAGGSTESSLYQVESYFNEIWNLNYTRPFHNRKSIGERTCVKRAAEELRELYTQYLADYPKAASPADYKAMTFPTQKITLLSNPTTAYTKEPTVFYALTELMKQARESITIHTPYIIANDFMYNAFAEIASAVPEARMMTNSVANNGNPFGAGDYRANFDKIRATGIQLLEYEGGVSYHGKSIVIDDDLSLVGSFNMDMRSVYLDTELMLVIDSEEVNAQLCDLLYRYEKECAIVQKDGSRIFPDGISPQEISSKKNFNIKILYNLLRWARRLL